MASLSGRQAGGKDEAEAHQSRRYSCAYNVFRRAFLSGLDDCWDGCMAMKRIRRRHASEEDVLLAACQYAGENFCDFEAWVRGQKRPKVSSEQLRDAITLLLPAVLAQRPPIKRLR